MVDKKDHHVVEQFKGKVICLVIRKVAKFIWSILLFRHLDAGRASRPAAHGVHDPRGPSPAFRTLDVRVGHAGAPREHGAVMVEGERSACGIFTLPQGFVLIRMMPLS